MQKQATIEEDEIDWYISQNPIDRYIKVDNIDNQSDTKSVRKNLKRHSHRQKPKKE